MDYDLSATWTVLLIVGAVWELAWKGAALWKASRRNQPGWFIALLLVNSLGVLPIIYLVTHLEHPNFEEFNHEKAIPIKG